MPPSHLPLLPGLYLSPVYLYFELILLGLSNNLSQLVLLNPFGKSEWTIRITRQVKEVSKKIECRSSKAERVMTRKKEMKMRNQEVWQQSGQVLVIPRLQVPGQRERVLVTPKLQALLIAAGKGIISHTRVSGKEEQKVARPKKAAVQPASANHTHDTRKDKDRISDASKEKNKGQDTSCADISGSEPEGKVYANLLACYMALDDQMRNEKPDPHSTPFIFYKRGDFRF
jgi:hypothetical protein